MPLVGIVVSFGFGVLDTQITRLALVQLPSAMFYLG
jgi:hypothetical protein